MEELHIKVPTVYKKEYLDKYQLLGYKLENEKCRFFYTTFDLFRDVSETDKARLDEIDKKYPLVSPLPFWPIIALCLLAVIYLTTILVLLLNNKIDGSNRLVVALLIALPSILLVLPAMFYSYFRMKKTLSRMTNNQERVKMIKEEIANAR